MAPLIVKFDKAKVHALYPEASMVPAMLIWQLPKNKRANLEEYCGNGDYLASKKLDGFFYMFNKTPNYSYLFSRNAGVNGLLTEKLDRVPQIRAALSMLPPDTLIVGEIYVPGKTSKAVTRIMGSLAPKAIARQNDEGWLHYYLNDIVTLDGVDLRDKPFSERIKILGEVFDTYLAKNEGYVSLAENISENIYETAIELMEAGEEGMVLKHKDSLYECGKRPAWSSIKIKQEDTVDVVITGFCNPTMEYKGTELETWPYWMDIADEYGEVFKTPVTKHYYNGWKNAIEISAYDSHGELVKIGTVSSGLNDAMRQAFATSPECYLNRVAEIKCMSVDADEHTIRHGYFLTLREDKNPEDCKFSIIFA